MRAEFEKIKKGAGEALRRAETLDDLDTIEVNYLGRRGALTSILRSLKNLSETDRRQVGADANTFRRDFELRLAERREELKRGDGGESLRRERIDVTRPGLKVPRGHLHPITQALRETEDIFMRMGFTVAEGPEIETEYYNFDVLNMAGDHPARDMQDTFWLKQRNTRGERLVLRTHTSAVQVRYMEKHEPPIRIIVPGIVYRYEATDASHDVEYWQLEGLMVDKDVSVGNFKAVIGRFFSELFGADVKTRLRPYYFPYTEPSFEVDMSCVQCKGRGWFDKLTTGGDKRRVARTSKSQEEMACPEPAEGCSVCQRAGWLEMMGAGMVHPSVLKAAGYNPNDVQGFAFGMGFDRIAMMKYKIPDIRLMRSGDLRFLNQF